MTLFLYSLVTTSLSFITYWKNAGSSYLYLAGNILYTFVESYNHHYLNLFRFSSPVLDFSLFLSFLFTLLHSFAESFFFFHIFLQNSLFFHFLFLFIVYFFLLYALYIFCFIFYWLCLHSFIFFEATLSFDTLPQL